mmetsp:Transcript_12488/g.37135  ORF Transcript_12488/g.37135 Transcript_12488/m.37135 type:complete len:868 (+) Transcript_12488:195-2798(+)|eukprot:CAMPEP_0119278328 /NCGR_PEP_ID=MMETSP1329-20130426/18884_1 /TAXON_ID=114041 /ORGANISM="Genus nov. species nov., Strain RCC1024" /LENGTH=867 /DNA_ID=CAMNT_0007278839 /DNA_START=114 /DNA_END=2717 /DNA_ORIENTATION=-
MTFESRSSDSEGEASARDSEYEYDSEGGGVLDEEPSNWLSDHYKTKKWETKEADLRREMTESGARAQALKLELCDKTAGGLGCASGALAPRNVFSGAASFKVLAADLLTLQHAAERAVHSERSGPAADLRVEADAVDDNVYHWQVYISRFPPGSPAQAQLSRLERVHGYGHVELEVRFTIDLYPFFPPLVRLVRPRFGSSALALVAQLRCLQLSHWNSVAGMAPVFRDIAHVLANEAAHAPLDVTDPRNDPYKCPEGAYTDLEHVLMRLGLLMETRPRESVPSHSNAPSGEQTLAPTRPDSHELSLVAESAVAALDDAEATASYWAKGTGYGHDDSKAAVAWDVDAFLAAQREKDRLVGAMLRRVLSVLMPGPSGGPGDAAAVKCIAASSLVPVLAHYAANESLVDASRHAELYGVTMRLLSVLADWPALAPILVCDVRDASRDADCISIAVAKVGAADADKPLPGPRALYDLVLGLKKRLGVFEHAQRKAVGRPALSPSIAQPGTINCVADGDDADSVALMPLVATAIADVDRAVRTLARTAPGASKRKHAPLTPPPAKRSKATVSTTLSYDINARYLASLKHLQYDDADETGAATWRLTPPSAARSHPAFRRRLAQEHVDVSQSLPLNPSSSAWCRCHPARMDCLRVAISAPEGTPYDAGFFIFDVRFPAQFPAKPPQVILLTTGQNTVRFNPNLYECGKVCLSLLGTWEGRGGETWNERTSTLLQVLVSIQALIFVPDPYYNEPGYETQMGTPPGDQRAAQYAANVKQQTVRWAMIDVLRNPDPAFRVIIEKHFALRRDHILSDLRRAIDDARRRAHLPGAPHAAGSSSTGEALEDPAFWHGQATSLVDLMGQLHELLDALPDP